jgi:GNAT superfamily N-acetyltransferase
MMKTIGMNIAKASSIVVIDGRRSYWGIRVDINGNQAIFRRVAIREDLQRARHGRVLLTLAESFAQERGCIHIWSDVAPDAVGFYERCGYTFVPPAPLTGTRISMQKNLA